MTMQRETNPLPVGRYSLDVADFPEGHLQEWFDYSQANKSKLHVVETEEHPSQGDVPRRLFTIFKTTEPVFFPAQNFGFPTIAPESVKTESDTEQVPDDDAIDPTSGALRVALIVGGVALVVGVAFYVVTKQSEQRALARISPALG